MPAARTVGADTRTLTILAFSAIGGTLVELYDFFIYGYAAASAFPAVFFPKLPPTQALVFSYLAFGAGFPARLVGAFIFGHFGDRAGRKFSFLLSIAIVGTTTCLTGLLPGYARLGIAAPVLLVVVRIVQGLGLGGEFGLLSQRRLIGWEVMFAFEAVHSGVLGGDLGVEAEGFPSLA